LRKRQTTVIRPFKNCSVVRIVVKGAPEHVLPLCTRMLKIDGTEDEITKEQNTNILNHEIIGNMARTYGYRTFAYAYKDIDSETWEDLQGEHDNFVDEAKRVIVEQDLTFIAAFGIEDKLRENVAKSVINLRKAKITVRMISGDNFETAVRCA